MAHRILCDDYCSLEKSLKNDMPFSVSAYYIVTQLIKGSLTNRSVWVDSWPTYSVVVVSDNQHKNAGLQRVCCFCRDIKNTLALDTVLQHVAKLLSNTLLLFGLRFGVLDQLLSYRSAAYRVSNDAVVMHMPKENIRQMFVLL
uniref:Glycine N-acyltransferase N-terminal domain-containing protein n=1 Tax=Magallana gigas TaxID=29159 RepID=A0A8W8NCD5_MAGGI